MATKGSKLVAIALVLKLAEHARRLELKKKVTAAEKRRLLKIRAAQSLLNNR